jgi:hypothetical protein
MLTRVRIARAGWTSASFLVYGGALLALVAAFTWQGVISSGLELLTLLAALAALRIFRFPLLVAIAAGAVWYFVTDLLSSGGNWSATVSLLVGLAMFLRALVLDGGDSRPYGFWVHVVAGLAVGGALLYWLHSGDWQWAVIIVFSLVFVLVGAAIRRSSYAVLGVVGLVLATGHYSFGEAFGLGSVERPTTWAVPVAYLCLGLFLVLVGMMLHRRGDAADVA